jgi:hypothetical protein
MKFGFTPEAEILNARLWQYWFCYPAVLVSYLTTGQNYSW